MNYKMVGSIIGTVLCIETVFMLPGILICLYDGEPSVALAYAAGTAVVVLVGLALRLACRNASPVYYAQEGLAATALSWIAMSALGCLPFVFSGQIPFYPDAFFEMVSGFTTTGSTILTDVEAVSRGLLYWRSFSHWLGGMGILVFLLAVVPASNGGSAMHLLRAESPGPSVEKVSARIGQSSRRLYLIYVALTVLNILFLLAGGMPPFEAFCHAVGTAGTGGFGVKNDSFMSYSPYLQNVTTVFMLLFGVNFSVYYMLLLKRLNALKDEELRLYLCLVVGSTALITVNIRSMYGTLEETVRHAAFQVASIITTTGFGSADFDLWPSFSKAILFTLMLVGACAGSTGGGMKVSRALLLMKSLYRSIRTILQPRSVRSITMNGNRVKEDVLNNLHAYFTAYCLLIVGSFLVVSLDGFSFETNLSAVVSCFNNIGPGLAQVGPTCNFSAYSALSKVVLSADMLLGRLEIFPVLALFTSQTWRRSL